MRRKSISYMYILPIMLFSKNLFNKNLKNYLIFRSFFKNYNLLFICSLANKQTTNYNLLKLKFQKSSLEYQFINFNKLILIDSKFSHLKFFQRSLFLIKINNLNLLPLLTSSDFFVTTAVYKNYFLNNIYFGSLFNSFKFFDQN